MRAIKNSVVKNNNDNSDDELSFHAWRRLTDETVRRQFQGEDNDEGDRRNQKRVRDTDGRKRLMSEIAPVRE